MDRGEGLDIDGIRTEVLEAYKDSSGEKLKALAIKYPYIHQNADVVNVAEGGRIGYGLGNLVSKSAGVFQPTSDSMSAGNAPSFEGGGGMGGMIADLIRKNPQMFSGGQNNSPVNQNTGRRGMFSKFFSNPRMYDKDFIDENFNYIDDREEAAMGGRIGYGVGGIINPFNEFETFKLKNLGYDVAGKGTEPFGGESVLRDILRVNKAYGGRIGMEEGGIMDLGGMEKDYRAEGGFVPIGKAEKADDVPARLSVNEFVFTADAVRNAGGGDIDRGAEVMENMMKNLEQGGQVSEESQGMGGAQEMFETCLTTIKRGSIMALKDILPGDRKKNKTIPVSHSKDHPDVQNIADKKLDKMRKKMFGGVGMIGDNYKKDKKMEAKAEKEAKKFMDTIQTMKSKTMTEREGSFAKGGLIKGKPKLAKKGWK